MKTKSILAGYSKINPVMKVSVEGEDYINVSKYSDTGLGKALAPGAKANFDTVFGKVGNVRAAMDYIAIPNYPVKLLSKAKLTASDINKIPGKRISVPNYWSIVTYIMAERIKADEKLHDMLKENDVELTCFSKIGKATMFGKEVFMSQPNKSMGRYIAVIRVLSNLIKEDKFTDENILDIVNQAKDHPEKGIFEGSTVNIEM